MPLLITQVKESQFMILLTQLYQYKQSKLTKLYDKNVKIWKMSSLKDDE